MSRQHPGRRQGAGRQPVHGASRLAELESRIGLALVKRQPTGYRIQRRGRPRSIAALANHAMIGFDGIMQGDRAATWLAQAVPSARIVNRNNSILGTLSAARAGIGVAALPTTLGDAEETPVQVLPPVDELARSWFLLTHPDLRRTPRIAAFVDHVLEDIPALRRALIG
jgi:DNA-binding transcriptional LysR family regulator